MIINPLNLTWFIYMGFLVALTVVLYTFGKNKDEKRKKGFFSVFFAIACVFYIWYKALLLKDPGYDTSIWKELPLALCQVAFIYGYAGVMKKSNVLMCFGVYVGFLCALMAVVMPVDGFYGIPFFEGRSIGFYGYHGMVIVQSVLVYMLGLYKPNRRHLPGMLIVLGASALIAHGLNLLIKATTGIAANYFFTVDPEGNPVLALLRGIIPVDYVYLLPLFIPLGIVLYFVILLMEPREKG
ncbi:MAG: YwaF family protein [Eubacteriales bacterium]|nr:YwaF family protein [Eubacteriales bacterium]